MSLRPLPAGSPEERFVAHLDAGERDAAAALLQARFGDELRRRLAKLALALGGADEAEHLANWAICQAVLTGASFDPGRGRLGPWLHRLARNLAISQLRKLRPARGLEREREARARSVQRALETRDALRDVLERMEPRLRRVLLVDLVHHGQAPAQLACGELGLERGLFYKRRSQARRVFRELWSELHGDPFDSFFAELP